MKEVIVKVPDNTAFIHVLIGTDEYDAIQMSSKSNGNRENLNISFVEGEEE